MTQFSEVAAAMPLIFCAADTVDQGRADSLAEAMVKAGCGLKIGLEFFNARGPDGLRVLTALQPDLKIFLDLKFHDIPNTVAGAVRAVVPLAPAFLNVHASGGSDMMKAAKEAAVETAVKHGIAVPRLLAVTVLTSLDEAALSAVGFSDGLSDRVLQLALLAKEAGMDGVVCAGHEIAALRRACGSDFVLMVPGIRPEGTATGDQKRVMTPDEALQAGATHLVIGRPITGAANVEQAASAILASTRGKQKKL